jgi:hypothetical protein
MIDNDHISIFGTNSETGLGEVRIIPTNDHDNKMRNLCIDLILEAGCESYLMDAVHAATRELGTSKHVLDSIVEWAGFVPHDEELKS